MKNIDLKHDELVEKIEKGLELSFKKLVKTKRQNGCVFVFSENGVIKKVKAEDIDDYNSRTFLVQIPILYR